MGFWAIICFIITAIAIDQGEQFLIIVFGGLGILLTYLWATRYERRRKREEKRQKKELAKKIQSAKERFCDSYFIAQVIQDFQARNWDDLDWGRSGCEVRGDKIVTPCQTYLYASYGLCYLDREGCKLLAIYLGEAYGGGYEVEAITEPHGCVGMGYSGFIGSDGSVSISRDCDAWDVFVGCKLYSKSSVPLPAPPVGKKW